MRPLPRPATSPVAPVGSRPLPSRRERGEQNIKRERHPLPKLVWSVLCAHPIVDQQTNNVSLINVIEQVQVSLSAIGPFPVTIPMGWSIVTLWRREDLDHPEQRVGRLRILGPGGGQLGEALFEIDLSEHERARTIATQTHLVLERIGTHRFIIEVQEDDTWDFRADLPVEVKETE